MQENDRPKDAELFSYANTVTPQSTTKVGPKIY